MRWPVRMKADLFGDPVEGPAGDPFVGEHVPAQATTGTRISLKLSNCMASLPIRGVGSQP